MIRAVLAVAIAVALLATTTPALSDAREGSTRIEMDRIATHVERTGADLAAGSTAVADADLAPRSVLRVRLPTGFARRSIEGARIGCRSEVDPDRNPNRDSNRDPDRDPNRDSNRDPDRDPNRDSNRDPDRDPNREATARLDGCELVLVWRMDENGVETRRIRGVTLAPEAAPIELSADGTLLRLEHRRRDGGDVVELRAIRPPGRDDDRIEV